MPDQQLDVAEFARLLAVGLGRAPLYLQNHDSTPYRDVILHACLHNLAYDAQVEGGRATYMLEVIERTGALPFYRDAILSALKTLLPDAEMYDINQLMRLTGYFAQRGDPEAHDLLYKLFNDHSLHASQDTYDLAFTGAAEIIEADGIPGFLYVASRFGELTPDEDNSFYFIDYFLGIAREKAGEEAVQQSIDQSRDPRVAAYLKHVQELELKRKANRKPPRPDPASLTYAEVKALIGQQKASLKTFIGWGENAAPADLLQAARDLETEKDPARLWDYLGIFRKADYPRDLDLLFSLAVSDHHRTAIGAIFVLSNMQRPSIRAFALGMIEKSKLTGKMVSLLVKNSEDGDWQLIERLTHRDLEREDYHDLGWNALEFFKLHPSPESIPALLTLYDRGPCGNCRRHFTQNLQTLNAVPARMIEECHHDASDAVRDLFEKPTI